MPVLVALIPQIYQEIRAPKVELQYEVNQGPAVLEDSLYNKIIVVSLYNTGSKISKNIVGKINVVDGRVKTYSHSETDILNPNFIHDRNIVEIDIPSMMPSDSLFLSLLIETDKDSSKIKVSFRSEEIVAFEKENGEDSKYLSIVSSLLTFLAVILTFFYSKSSLRTSINNLEIDIDKQNERRKELEKKLDDAKKLAFDLKKSFNEMMQDDVIFYLSLLIQD